MGRLPGGSVKAGEDSRHVAAQSAGSHHAMSCCLHLRQPSPHLTVSTRSEQATTLAPRKQPGMYFMFSCRSLISSVSFLQGGARGRRGRRRRR